MNRSGGAIFWMLIFKIILFLFCSLLFFLYNTGTFAFIHTHTDKPHKGSLSVHTSLNLVGLDASRPIIATDASVSNNRELFISVRVLRRELSHTPEVGPVQWTSTRNNNLPTRLTLHGRTGDSLREREGDLLAINSRTWCQSTKEYGWRGIWLESHIRGNEMCVL